MLALVLACALQARPQAVALDLGAALAAAVDLPDAAARRCAADALARKPGVAVAQWLDACAAFGAFAARPPGEREEAVDLAVDGRVQPARILVYTPKGYDPRRPSAVLLWNHDVGGSGARAAVEWEELADRLGLIVLAPTEPAQDLDVTAAARARQFAALRWARRRFDVDENAVFLGGVARGGRMTWDVALRTPDLWAGLVPCAGGPRLETAPGPSNMRYLENVAHLPIRDLQGKLDDSRLLANLNLAFDRLRALQAVDARLIEFAERSGYDLDAVDWPRFFALRRAAVPARVVRTAAEPAETRAFWAEIVAFEPQVAADFRVEVAPAAWDRLDDAGRRALVLDQVSARTARFCVTMRRPGSFVAEGSGVARFRLLLTRAMLGPGGSVEVKWRGKATRTRAVPSSAVLLREFVERFDRTFLPVAEVVVP